MKLRLALIATLFLQSHTAFATLNCPSDFFAFDKCVPISVIDGAVSSAAGKPFMDWIRDLYAAASEATGKKNPLRADPKVQKTPWVEMFPGSPMIFGNQELQPARTKQLELLKAYCAANGGKVKQFTMLGHKRERVDAICVGGDGNGIGGIVVMPPTSHRVLTSLFVLEFDYLPPEIAKAITDFWKNIKVGDKTMSGMVIEVKAPIAKIQTITKNEEWIEIETLIPRGVL